VSQGFYLEETSYRLIESLTLAAERIADRLDELAQQSTNTTKAKIQPCVNKRCDAWSKGIEGNCCEWELSDMTKCNDYRAEQ